MLTEAEFEDVIINKLNTLGLLPTFTESIIALQCSQGKKICV